MKKLSLLVCFVALAACDRAEKQSTTNVTLNLPERFSESLTVQGLNPDGLIIPSSVNDFNCYALLISGPEDFLKKNTCQYKSNSAYFPVGYFRGGYYFATAANVGAKAISLEIESGKDRAVRLIGFKVVAPNTFLSAATICQGFKYIESFQQHISDPYILSEKTGLEMPASGSVTLDMKATFSATNQVGDCKGPDFNNFNETKLPPARFAAMLQSGVGVAGKPLRLNDCVGVRFQLRDANNGNPDLSSNAIIKATIKTVDGSGNPIGSFYNPNTTSPTFCASADMTATTGSGDISISFNANTTGPLFRDVLLFYEPYSPLSSDIQLAVLNDNSSISMSGVVKPLSWDVTSSDPTKYAVYDFFNNTTFSNTVRVNECRTGAVQFMDVNDVPTGIFTSGGPYQTIGVTSSAPANVSFFSSGDCTGGSSNTAYLNPLNNTYLAGLKFFYRVNAAISNFTFSVTNSNTGTPAVSGGDVVSPAWKSE